MQREVLFATFKNEATEGALGNTLQREYSTAGWGIVTSTAHAWGNTIDSGQPTRLLTVAISGAGANLAPPGFLGIRIFPPFYSVNPSV